MRKTSKRRRGMFHSLVIIGATAGFVAVTNVGIWAGRTLASKRRNG